MKIEQCRNISYNLKMKREEHLKHCPIMQVTS